MCFNCGCMIPDDNMGSEDNITNKTFEDLAKSWGLKDKEEVKQIFLKYLTTGDGSGKNAEIEKVFKTAGKSWGQSVEEAKKYTQKLLEKEG